MAQLDYLVTGATGQLGRAVVALAQQRAASVLGFSGKDLPLDNRARIQQVLLEHRPKNVIHCAAVTNVDGCEGDPLLAYRVNGLGTAWLAEAAAAIAGKLVYVSTDFVFDGTQQGVPYEVDARVSPLSVYGASKRLGEEAVLSYDRAKNYVVRTSWVFGPGGKNFPRAIIDRARSGQPLKVVTDQIGRPCMTFDLAEALLDLCELAPLPGIYHAANEGQCSWHQFAVDVLRLAGLSNISVGTQLAVELKRAAARPAWSVLDTARLTAARGKPLPHYVDAIQRYLQLESQITKDPAAAIAAAGLRGKEYRS
ncbi:MAG: dTDP-4-dehydrorhamnose reductase [Planctomycetota bacterium]|nr:dTDP-4-dehydrorhamnose reductase [Planctomycetota bacterium]